MECRGNLILVDELEQHEVVSQSPEVGNGKQCLHDPPVQHAVLVLGSLAVQQLDGFSFCSEIARSRPSDIDKAWQEHDLADPEIRAEEVELLGVRGLQPVAQSLFNVEVHANRIEDDGNKCPNDDHPVHQVVVLHEEIVIFLIRDVEVCQQNAHHVRCEELSRVRRPVLIVEHEDKGVKLKHSD